MPHRRHRVRVHVHNRYVRTQSPQQANCRKKRCRNGSRCRRRDGEQYRPEDDYDRPVGLGVTQDGRPGQRRCQRFHSAEEVCRRGCDGARRQKGDSRRHGAAEGGRYGGYDSDGDGGPCGRCGRSRTAAGGCGCEPGNAVRDCGKRRDGGGSRPGTPCERFRSAEETCRACPPTSDQRQQETYGQQQRQQQQQQQTNGQYQRQQQRQVYGQYQRQQQQYQDRGHQDIGRTGPQTSYNVYTAQVQGRGFTGESQPVQRPPEMSSHSLPDGTPLSGRPTKAPSCPDPAEVTEEIIHTREHRWHIPSAQTKAVSRREELGPQGTVRRGADPCDAALDGRPSADRSGSRSSVGSRQGSAARSRPTPAPVGESGSDGGRRRAASVAGVRRTRSELLAGREMVARIARQVELDDGTRTQHQLVYRLSAQFGAQFSRSDTDSDSGQRLSEPGTERTSQTAQTVLRLERLRLEDVSDSPSWSDGGGPAGSGSPRPAPRSARPAEPPSPLPRRQVTSEPTLPAPPGPAPAPATRTSRSLDCQPAKVADRGRTKKLRTRGALTRLRQLSVTRLNQERQRRLLTGQLVTQTDHLQQATGKQCPDRHSDGEDGARPEMTVLHAQNLLPVEYQGPGSRGDAAAEPVYQNIDKPYDSTAVKPGDSPGYSGGGGGGPGGFSPIQPESGSPHQSRAADPYQKGPSQYGNYGDGRSPYLETSPTGRSARDRFDDDDPLGAALYEQRYQPRRDNSPYLSRPTDRAVAAPGTDIRAGTGAPLQRQGGRQRLGVGRRGVSLGQRLQRGFSELRQRGAALYRRLTAGRGQTRAGRARGRGRTAPPARSAGGARKRRPDTADGCSCDESDSDRGAVNCSFLFYFNGDGGSSPFMCNVPAAIAGVANPHRGISAMSKKYCDMCD